MSLARALTSPIRRVSLKLSLIGLFGLGSVGLLLALPVPGLLPRIGIERQRSPHG